MFTELTKDYLKNLDGLVNFASQIDPFLTAKLLETVQENEKNIRPLMYFFNKVSDDSFLYEHFNLSEIDEEFERTIETGEIESDDCNPILTGVDKKDFESALKQFTECTEQIDSLYNNCLINLVTYTEIFYFNALKIFFSIHPNYIVDDKILSKDTYQNIISDVYDESTDTAVEKAKSITSGGYKSFIKKFKKIPEILIPEDLPDQADIKDVYKIRNLLVHNNGIINKKYLKGKSKRTLPLLPGQKINVSSELLNDAIQIFRNNSILLVNALWTILQPSSIGRVEIIESLEAYDNAN